MRGDNFEFFTPKHVIKHVIDSDNYTRICCVCALLQGGLECFADCDYRQDIVSRLIEGAE